MAPGVTIDLAAVIVAVRDGEAPLVLVRAAPGGEAPALPSGPFDPVADRTLEQGVRRWVGEQTGLALGYVEQLYTFGDRGRDPREAAGGARLVSVAYLALVRAGSLAVDGGGVWAEWYRFFPWEDWREGRPALLERVILPRLVRWAAEADTAERRARRAERVALVFGQSAGGTWDEERVLERYELLYEAGLVAESGAVAAPALGDRKLALDHRRILATAMGRLRAKLKYRPVVFELMPPEFTLTGLQRAVEALAGVGLHKQNFRRLVETHGLVEPTGGQATDTGGRPAAEFRFRPRVLLERPAPGLRLAGRPGGE